MHLRPEDKVLILEANARFNHAFDTQDVVEWLDTWTDYATFITDEGRIEGKAAMRDWFSSQMPSSGGLRHFTFNIVSDGDIETASATCDFLVMKLGEHPEIVATGHYEDNLTRIGEAWKFATRKIVHDLAAVPRRVPA